MFADGTARRRRAGRAQPLRDRSQRRAAGRAAADLAAAGADLHRPAGAAASGCRASAASRSGRGSTSTRCGPSTRASRQDGLVVSRQGQGTFVADGVEAAPELEEIAAEALRRAREAGLGPRELAIVAMACASIPGDVGGEAPAPLPPGLPDLEEESEAIEVRQELRRQIGRLEAELATYTRDLAPDLPTAPRRAVAHVAGVRGAGADPRHADRPALRSAAGGGAAGAAGSADSRAPAAGPGGRGAGAWATPAAARSAGR